MTTSSFDILAVVGAATGVVGTITGVVALVWQIATRRRLAHRVRVTMSYVIPVYGNVPGDDDQVCITAVNLGTTPVQITHWSLLLANDQHVTATRPFALSTPLPHRLEGGSEAAFYFPVDELRSYHQRTSYPFRKIKARVTLATGQKVVSRKGVPLR